MKVLVTGGTGFTGKALVKRLLDEGHEVVALDYKEGVKTDELRQWGAEVVIGTVVDEQLMDRCMEGVDLVHHLAAAFRELDVPESHYHHINVDGTRITLESARRHGVRRFIYMSTCGVHGNVGRRPASEESPIRPADYYQQTKYEAEPLVLGANSDEMRTVVLRPAAIYGPGDPERFFMIFRRVAKGVFPMFGSGKTFYHPLYIDNLVDACLLVMEEGKGDGQCYLIADDEYVEIEDLVRRVARAMDREVRIPHYPILPLIVAGHFFEKTCKPFGIAPPIFPRRVDWYRQNRAFDISKARREIGYDPRVGLDEGLKKTYEWYVAEGYL
ncbi:MAG TPA: NAD(P)-dependent oxidoreductase [Thiotrichales bacterium]|nr:NAD(P)-dependent oxidoreductase [Thiotrichales bacterium]